jgi:hypothetical protein
VAHFFMITDDIQIWQIGKKIKVGDFLPVDNVKQYCWLVWEVTENINYCFFKVDDNVSSND